MVSCTIIAIIAEFKLGYSKNVKVSYIMTSKLSFFYFSTNVLPFIAVSRRIKSINKCFKIKPQTSVEAQKVLKVLSRVYIKFYDSINLFNKCFGFIVLLRTFKFILHITLFLFGVYSIIFNDSTPQFRAFFVMAGIYDFLEFVLILPLVIISSQIKKENSKFYSKFQNFQSSFGLLNSPDLQIPSFDLSVSCGLFKVDWKFMFMVMTAVFSGLIVLIQFDMIFQAQNV
jgi:hypothetical protein